MCSHLYFLFSGYNILCDFYHGQRKQSDRTTAHEMFMRDELDVIVATVAFGMGIDKPGKLIIFSTFHLNCDSLHEFFSQIF